LLFGIRAGRYVGTVQGCSGIRRGESQLTGALCRLAVAILQKPSWTCHLRPTSGFKDRPLIRSDYHRRICHCSNGNARYDLIQCSDAFRKADATATFRELGPPDLCQVIKSSGSKAAQRDVSTKYIVLSSAFADLLSWDLITIGKSARYSQYWTSIDQQFGRGGFILSVSSCVSQFAPVFNRRTQCLVRQRLRMEGQEWDILVSSSLHDKPFSLLMWCSCFNAFSRVDMRVDVRIPGGVDAYIVDPRGER
jgi:hypothetical protein